jgi:hypothetical protein
MKSLTDFIVKPKNNKRYSNTKNIGGVDFVVSSSQEDHKFSNREAVVLETPLGYSGPIKKGDTLLVHHNVFKFYNDMYGRQKSGRSMYINKNTTYEPLLGVMKYSNKYLKSQGINNGDTVSFIPESEYEFHVDGELLYRLYDHQITVKL